MFQMLNNRIFFHCLCFFCWQGKKLKHIDAIWTKKKEHKKGYLSQTANLFC